MTPPLITVTPPTPLNPAPFPLSGRGSPKGAAPPRPRPPSWGRSLARCGGWARSSGSWRWNWGKSGRNRLKSAGPCASSAPRPRDVTRLIKIPPAPPTAAACVLVCVWGKRGVAPNPPEIPAVFLNKEPKKPRIQPKIHLEMPQYKCQGAGGGAKGMIDSSYCPPIGWQSVVGRQATPPLS